MDYRITQENIPVLQTLFDESIEHPIDIEFSMPDYFPDIQRILKCHAQPIIFSKQLGSDGLNIEGKINIRLFYYDTDNQIHCCEHSQSFSLVMHPKDIPQSPLITTRCAVEYINCRAATGRRVDIHGSFTVFAKITGTVNECIITDADGEGIQPLYDKMDISTVVGNAERIFTVEEVLEIGQSKMGAQSILRSQANAALNDIKLIQGKAIIKGELTIKILYCTDSQPSEIESMEYLLPISQIMDIDGVNEDCICDACFDVISCDVTIGNHSSDQPRLFECDVKIAARACAFAPSQCELISDAYSTKYDLITENHSVTLQRVLEIVNDEHLMRSTIEAPDSGISKIIDLWSDNPTCKTAIQEDQLIMDIELRLCLLAMDTNATPVYFERQLQTRYEHKLIESPLQISFPVVLSLSDLGFALTGDKQIDIRCNIKLSGALSSIFTVNSICELKPNESSPKPENQLGTMAIYYPENGERLFDIARSYNTSMQSIIRENGLDEAYTELGHILIIPLVQS